MKAGGQRRKHIPQRSCIACGEKKDKGRLTRLVRTGDQGVAVDPTGRLAGRGAYLCDRPACWQKVVNTDLLDRALRARIAAEEKKGLALHRPMAVEDTAD